MVCSHGLLTTPIRTKETTMETRFENVTVYTEQLMRNMYGILNRKSILTSLLLFVGLLVVFVVPNIIDGISYSAGILIAIYCFFGVKTVIRPMRMAKEHYLQRLAYYDNSMPPENYRFYDDYFVRSDVDSTEITPYRKIRQVRVEKGLILIYRQDNQVFSMSAESFTKGTFQDFCQFIQLQATKAITQE